MNDTIKESPHYLLQLHGKLAIQLLNPYAIIDIKFIDIINKHKWYIGKNGYPFAYIKNSTGQTSRVNLHRYVHWLEYNVWTHLYIDHINRNKLDARLCNLREATPAENSYNKTNTNPNHNIKLIKSTNTYEVTISKNNTIHKINNIHFLDDAKEIYKLMSNELYGDFAPNV